MKRHSITTIWVLALYVYINFEYMFMQHNAEILTQHCIQYHSGRMIMIYYIQRYLDRFVVII